MNVYDIKPGTSVERLRAAISRDGADQVIFRTAKGELKVLEDTSKATNPVIRGTVEDFRDARARHVSIQRDIIVRDAHGGKIAGKVLYAEWEGRHHQGLRAPGSGVSAFGRARPVDGFVINSR